MKKLLGMFIVGIIFLGMVSAQHIWTTKNACGDESQDNGQYSAGDLIYVNGKDMKDSDGKGYDWFIVGHPSSCDSEDLIESGLEMDSDKDGNFCFLAYTVLEDDCGIYQVNVESKQRQYSVNEKDTTPVVPEFGTVVGILTALGALGVFFVVRKR